MTTEETDLEKYYRFITDDVAEFRKERGEKLYLITYRGSYPQCPDHSVAYWAKSRNEAVQMAMELPFVVEVLDVKEWNYEK